MAIVKPNDIVGPSPAQLIDENFDEIFEEVSALERKVNTIEPTTATVDLSGADIVDAIDTQLGHSRWRTGKTISSITQNNLSVLIIYTDGTMTTINLSSSGSQALAAVQTDAPANPPTGLFWWDTDDDT